MKPVPPFSLTLPELTLLQEIEPALARPVPWQTRCFAQSIPAGFPLPTTDYAEQGLDLNDYLMPRKASTFLFTVVGYSMQGAGILDGDKVCVDRAADPRDLSIVVAVVNGEYCLKRLYLRGDVIELRSENPAYSPIRFSGMDELVIWGTVTGVVRRLQR
jgi:DNA polymerase V